MFSYKPAPLPDVVYHYTSIDTMMKIVASQSIWATSVRYLNDTSEQIHFFNLVRQRIEAIKFDNEDYYEAAKLFRSQVNSPQTFMGHPFVASFSNDGDSLSQWRSYCNAGNGVAIGFSTNCLARASVGINLPFTPLRTFTPIMYRLKPVTYTAPTDYQEFDAAVLRLVSIAVRLIEGIKRSNPTMGPRVAKRELSIQINAFFRQEACFRKSHDFRSEDEYRIVVDLGAFEPERYAAVKYRTSRSCLIPYVELAIPRFEDGFVSDPEPIDLDKPFTDSFQFIKRLVVGPSPNINLTLEAIKSFFKTNRIKIDVVPSAVPFRDL